MKFVLSIELGNDAMNFGYEVAEALEAAGKDLREAHESNRGHDVKHWDKFDQSHIIRDCNGNTVGKWEVIDQPAKPQVKTVWALAIDGNHIGTEASIFTSELKLYEHLAEAMGPSDDEQEKIAAFVAANDAVGLAAFVTETMEVPDLFTYCIDHMDL